MPNACLIRLVLLLAAATAGCHGTNPQDIRPGMKLDVAVNLLNREGLVVEEDTGAQLLRSFAVSDPQSIDAPWTLCFTIDRERVKEIFWYKNRAADRALPKGKRKYEYVVVSSITPREIRAGLLP
jgi:hypothetical protein